MSNSNIPKKENALQESALRLNAIVNSAIDGIITIDEKGIVETVNPAAAKLFGFNEEEIVGNNISMLMPSPYQEEHDQYLENYHQTGNRKIIGIGREVAGRRKDGTVFPIRLAVSETWIGNRRIYTGIIHDLTKVKEAEEEIRRLNVELEQKVDERTEKLGEVVNRLLRTNKTLENEIIERALVQETLLQTQNELKESLAKERELNELKSRFVSMASHEFRTPLSTILSSVSLIGRYTDTDQQPQREKHIDRIKASVNTLTGILNDFLSLSKLEEGKEEWKPGYFDFKEFLADVLDEINGSLKNGQEIHCEVPDDSVEVYLDNRHLKIILFNLISNAIKYSPEGKPIRCHVALLNNELSIKIKDEGIGIPKEEQAHLFTRFFRAKNAINIQGTGLGLNIVKRYVELQNGRISFESRQGEGSTFEVIFPHVTPDTNN